EFHYLAVGALHISPREFWDLTPHQLLSLADQHQAAQQTGGRRNPEPATGASLLGLAGMRRR
ncbi:MAG TPA: phage tail assembly chaperone, partial [Micromonosporaceae bacterium]|nr:phage tail assembly chaperone [Micromonosporaceae bacterium]